MELKDVRFLFTDINEAPELLPSIDPRIIGYHSCDHLRAPVTESQQICLSETAGC